MIDETLKEMYMHVLVRKKELEQVDNGDMAVMIFRHAKNSVVKTKSSRGELYSNNLVCMNKHTGQSNLITPYDWRRISFWDLKEQLEKLGIK